MDTKRRGAIVAIAKSTLTVKFLCQKRHLHELSILLGLDFNIRLTSCFTSLAYRLSTVLSPYSFITFILALVVMYVVVKVTDFVGVSKRSVTIRGRNRKSPPRALQFPLKRGVALG